MWTWITLCVRNPGDFDGWLSLFGSLMLPNKTWFARWCGTIASGHSLNEVSIALTHLLESYGTREFVQSEICSTYQLHRHKIFLVRCIYIYIYRWWRRGVACLIISHPVTSQQILTIWHKSLLSNLPFYIFHSSLCTFISNFLSDQSISAIKHGKWSAPKKWCSTGSCNITHSLIFNNDLSITNSSINSYPTDSTFFTRTSQHEQHNSRLELIT